MSSVSSYGKAIFQLFSTSPDNADGFSSDSSTPESPAPTSVYLSLGKTIGEYIKSNGLLPPAIHLTNDKDNEWWTDRPEVSCGNLSNTVNPEDDDKAEVFVYLRTIHYTPPSDRSEALQNLLDTNRMVRITFTSPDKSVSGQDWAQSKLLEKVRENDISHSKEFSTFAFEDDQDRKQLRWDIELPATYTGMDDPTLPETSIEGSVSLDFWLAVGEKFYPSKLQKDGTYFRPEGGIYTPLGTDSGPSSPKTHRSWSVEWKNKVDENLSEIPEEASGQDM